MRALAIKRKRNLTTDNVEFFNGIRQKWPSRRLKIRRSTLTDDAGVMRSDDSRGERHWCPVLAGWSRYRAALQVLERNCGQPL